MKEFAKYIGAVVMSGVAILVIPFLRNTTITNLIIGWFCC